MNVVVGAVIENDRKYLLVQEAIANYQNKLIAPIDMVDILKD